MPRTVAAMTTAGRSRPNPAVLGERLRAVSVIGLRNAERSSRFGCKPGAAGPADRLRS